MSLDPMETILEALAFSETAAHEQMYKTYSADKVLAAFVRAREDLTRQKENLTQTREAAAATLAAWKHFDGDGQPAIPATGEDFLQRRVFYTLSPTQSFLLGFGYRKRKMSFFKLNELSPDRDARLFFGKPVQFARSVLSHKIIERGLHTADFSKYIAAMEEVERKMGIAHKAHRVLQSSSSRNELAELDNALSACETSIQNIVTVIQSGIPTLMITRYSSLRQRIDEFESGHAESVLFSFSIRHVVQEEELLPTVQIERHAKLADASVRDALRVATIDAFKAGNIEAARRLNDAATSRDQGKMLAALRTVRGLIN